VQGPCPNCGEPAQTYFGDIFTVKGSRTDNEVQCGNCKAKIIFNAEKRSVRLPSLR
jgi:DNA-directed RNA polymerase subunit RPC12/RpoP